MYKISIIVCIVLMVFFVGMIMWEDNKDKQLDEQLEDAVANYLLVESKHKPMIIEVVEAEKGKSLILTYEKALELKREFPIGRYTYFFKDLQWPITQSISIEKFIEWLYENDYKIVKKEER